MPLTSLLDLTASEKILDFGQRRLLICRLDGAPALINRGLNVGPAGNPLRKRLQILEGLPGVLRSNRGSCTDRFRSAAALRLLPQQAHSISTASRFTRAIRIE